MGVKEKFAVSNRAISGHAVGVNIAGSARGQIVGRSDLSSATGRVLASQRPNTDRRRFVTHS
jgi:hypothetical protein